MIRTGASHLAFLLILASSATAASITVADGDFALADWTFSSWSVPGAPARNYAEVARGDDGGDPLLVVTTHSFDGGYPVRGVAIYDRFVFDPGADGEILALEMTLDVKSISGWGQGQNIRLVLFQDGQRFYGRPGLNSGSATSWLNHSHPAPTSFEVDSGAVSAPDFGRTGGPIRFGFSAGNHISRDYVQWYDNWEITITTAVIPEPTSAVLLCLALALVAAARRRRGSSAKRESGA